MGVVEGVFGIIRVLLTGVGPIIILVILFLMFAALKVLKEYERGRDIPPGPGGGSQKGPGLIILIPIDRPHGQGVLCAPWPWMWRPRM